MSSQPNGDIVIEYNSRREAEVAKSNGAVYENTPMRIDWYQNLQSSASTENGSSSSADQTSSHHMNTDHHHNNNNMMTDS